MNFDNDEDIMKAIMGGGGAGGGADIDDELAALEAEVSGGQKKKGDGDGLSDLEDEIEAEEKGKAKPKAKEKHDSDDDLAALEKEGLDDEEEEKPKPKPVKKEVTQPPKPKPEPKKEPPKPAQVPKGVDLYPEKTESKYHNVNKMTSLGVLEEEDKICDKIITYKKSRGDDYDDWENKKENIKDKISTVTSFIQNGAWDIVMYKKQIKDQYQWELKLLQFVEKDPTLNEEQKKVLKDRVESRKKIIEKEMAQKVEEGGDEAEEPKKEEPKKEVPKGVDLYPEKTENKYHNVNKMTSLGVLEEEDKICDKIIAYKKSRDEDYDVWEDKKESIKDKMSTVTSFIQNEAWDIVMYKKQIKVQYQWELKLLQFVEKDPTLNEEQKKVLKDRVESRKKIIEKEIAQNVEEGGAEEEEPKKEEPKKEEPKKEEHKKPAPKKEIIETKKSLNPIFDVPKDKEESEKKRLNDVVVDRLNEYRAALDYFKNHELAEQRIDATNKAKLICIELKKIQDGKWKEVNEFKLPDPVTPEYIYGYKKQERTEKFKKIILELGKQRKNVADELTNKLADLKKHPSKIKKDKAGVTRELNELKTKKEKYDKIINLLKEKFQDVWVPAPLYVETEKEIKIQKINNDVPENHVHVIFGKTTYTKDKLYLIVKVEGKDNLEKKFDQKKPGEFNHTIDWLVDKNDFKTFFRAKIKAEIYEKKFFKDAFKGQIMIEPKELKDQADFSKSFPIDLENGKKDQVAEITFKVRTPCKDPEYITEMIPYFQVTKIYPPFNLKGNTQQAIQFNVEQTNVTSKDLNITTVKQPQAKPVAKPGAKPNPQAARPKAPAGGGAKPGAPGPKKPSAPVDKSQFTEEELKDPDCLSCLNTLMVLKFKHEKYEEIRNKIDGRTPRELMQRIVKLKCKYQQIENSMGDEISPQDYSILLKTTFDHDKKLAEYFKQIGDKEKYQLVNERLPLIIKEMEELMKVMPK